MRKIYTLMAMVVSFSGLGQAVMTTSNNANGSWTAAANWSGGNVGDVSTETVLINENVSPKVISGTVEVGATTITNNTTLTVQNGATLIIWGNLISNGNFSLNIETGGTVTVKGNMQLSSVNSNMTINGVLNINGSLTGGNNINFNVNGTVNVGSSVTVAGGSNLNGCTGCFRIGGTCTGPASFCSRSTLPVDLVYIKANQVKNEVQVQWSVASEKDLDKYIIERLGVGENFVVMGEQKGLASAGSSALTKYSFIDKQPLIGDNYYRLKSVDLDGKFEYSPVVHTVFDGPTSISLHPNPAGQTIHVTSNFKRSGKHTVQFFDNLGSKVYEVFMPDNGAELSLDHGLKPGVYLMRYLSDAHQQIVRFIVK